MARLSLAYIFLLPFLMINLLSCHRPVIKAERTVGQDPVSLTKRDVHIVFIPDNKRAPAFLTYQKVDKWTFFENQNNAPFTMELTINPLMRNPSMTAKVLSKGKVVRQFTAKKTPTSVMSDKTTSWSPARSKLLLSIPFLMAHEEVVITTSYEWMDIRWLSPIMFQDQGLLEASSLTIDVPYGTTMHFKSAKDREPFEFLPTSTSYEQKLWSQEDNRTGLGMRHLWRSDSKSLSESKVMANQLQLFVSFETPRHSSAAMKFDNWQVVANYLLDRIEQYDVPSDAIRDYAQRKIEEAGSDQDKVEKILSYVQTIKKRMQVGSFQDQEVQPATRTFARNYGSSFDIAILGKAMLTSAGIASNLVLASDKRYNPSITDFYSPALFYTILLAIDVEGKTWYFDPESNSLDQLSVNLQGQHALLLRQKNALLFSIPFSSADKNRQVYSYQLWMNEDGIVEGDYSVDVTGFFAESLRDLSHEQLRLALPSDIQARLSGALDPAFSWATMAIEAIPEGRGYSVFGSIKPKLLAKAEKGNYAFEMTKLTAPLMTLLKAPNQRGFANTGSLSLFLSLPEDFEAQKIPETRVIKLDGIDSRFSASMNEDRLILEGTSTISLPVRKDALDDLQQKLLSLSEWQEHTILIHDKRVMQESLNNEQPAEHQPEQQPEQQQPEQRQPESGPSQPTESKPEIGNEPENLFQDQTSS